MTETEILNIDTSCRKCGAAMPSLASMANSATFTVTGYSCPECKHWNDLKRRLQAARRRVKNQETGG